MSRRHLQLASALAVACVGMTACSGGDSSGGSGATGADGWSREFEGTQLNVMAEATANSTILEEMLPEFTDATGIEVNLEQAPYDGVVQKSVLDFTTKKGTYDVVSIPYEYLGSFAEQEYVLPLDDYLADPPVELGKTFDEDDILTSLWEASSTWKDATYGMPSNSAVMMMLYRKDLFENADEQKGFQQKYGYALAPATTWEQYRDIAEWFTRDKGEELAGKPAPEKVYGVTLAGKRHVSTVLEWMNYSWTFGGDIFSSSGQVAVDSPENVESLSYEEDLTAFAPPGYTSATWDEITAQLQQGTAVQSITWGDTAGAMEDDSSSKVVGDMGYASIPVLREGDEPTAHLGSWTYTISESSKNQEAAYEFIAWAMSKPVQQELASGGGLPALTSTFEDKELNDSLPYWSQELVSLEEAKSRPRIPQWSGMADVLGLELSRALSGQASPEQALGRAQDKITKLMSGDLPVKYQ